MDRQYPIYTADQECQDCYKCVRHCPVKAIKIENARAAVMPEFCVACGHCVSICPAGAKRVRDDLDLVRKLLQDEKRVYLSLAPSYVGEFDADEAARLPQLLIDIGFAGVSETALGADTVSEEYRVMIEGRSAGLAISTACPVAVEFIQKYLAEYAEHLLPLPSPMMMHGRMLREWYGEDIAVVFAGPCIAKKRESDHFSQVIDAALTFAELRRLLTEENAFESKPQGAGMAGFVPHEAGYGAVYPVNGGMIDVIGPTGTADMVTVSGLDHIRDALRGLNETRLKRPLFLELLACEGGCINGPGMTCDKAGLVREVAVRERGRNAADVRRDAVKKQDTDYVLREPPVCREEPNEREISRALRRVGKICREDELNCGGCGYETCRAFAAALLDGRAEPAMCLSYMRRQAQKKANALLRSMPSGVVIADADLRVIECNEPFARMFGQDTLLSFQARPGLEGARIDKILPFADAFGRVLKTNRTCRFELMRVGEHLLNITVFPIEVHQTVGCIMQDVTATELHRERIALRAREVIDKNLATVQDIACRLGEHMADTELLLRSIASDYGKKDELGSGECEV